MWKTTVSVPCLDKLRVVMLWL